MKTNGEWIEKACSAPVVRCFARNRSKLVALHARANASGRLRVVAMEGFWVGILDIWLWVPPRTPIHSVEHVTKEAVDEQPPLPGQELDSTGSTCVTTLN